MLPICNRRSHKSAIPAKLQSAGVFQVLPILWATAIKNGYRFIMQELNELKNFRRHVVLVAPEVHWNTGNIGRTCLGAEAVLHLIKPLGFSLDDRQVKRAGLDYWPKVPLRVWDDFDHFIRELEPVEDELVLMTKNGTRPYWQMPFPQRIIMVFGSETRGIPAPILERYGNRTFYIPIQSHIRCLNLSTAVGIALYENVRQWAINYR
jgi:tRNA (cytidine/uridine-2'-O-)-methyltransferase